MLYRAGIWRKQEEIKKILISDASCLSLYAKYCDLSLQDRKTHPSLRNWYCFEDSVEVEVAELRKIWAKLIFVVRRSKILGNRQLQRRTCYTKECTLPYSAHPIFSVPLLKISWGYLVEYLHNLSTPSWLWKSHSLNIHSCHTWVSFVWSSHFDY